MESNDLKRNVEDAWLQYHRHIDEDTKNVYASYFTHISVFVSEEIRETIENEMKIFASESMGISGSKFSSDDIKNSHLIIGERKLLDTVVSESLKMQDKEIGFEIVHLKSDRKIIISGKTPSDIIYGTFFLIKAVIKGVLPEEIQGIHIAKNGLRMIQHWDNLDGTVERGYAGRSIFFENNVILQDNQKIKKYARLLSSIGINAISINNVNVHEQETKLITKEYSEDVIRLTEIFRRYGIKVFLSINFSSPILIGGLATADPLNMDVKNWWIGKANEIYHIIPDFGGFLIKADSEWNPGPYTYNRTQAEGANTIAEALLPHGGILMWRCFVYNNQQDWRDRTVDRARSAFDSFIDLDGKFLENVILQIKNGPVDFQVREPVSPLLGGLKNTNMNLEFQITQEYTGQQIDLCYLPTMWKEVLDFKMDGKDSHSKVSSIISLAGKRKFGGGIVGISNIGRSEHWTGHPLAQANLYVFGELSYDPEINLESATNEWIILTFGNRREVISTLHDILLKSHSVYEKYVAPMGVGWMVTPGTHYGPNVDGYEYSKWGTYHYADNKGIGVDRTTLTGTGYINQYSQYWRETYENLSTCPDNLLLFFHHVPYQHMLKNGKTLIQEIYDSHFLGAEQVTKMIRDWNKIREFIDSETYEEVLKRMKSQLANALEWRDVINTYFFRKTGIYDEKGRKIFP